MTRILFSVILLFSTFCFAADIMTLVDCRQAYTDGEVKDEKAFKILRDGDRLFSLYRGSKVDEFRESDDVTRKVIEGSALQDLFSDEDKAPIVAAFESSRAKIKKVVFHGVDQQNRPEEPKGSFVPKYLFEVWYGVTEYSTTRKVLIKDQLVKCDSKKSYWPFNQF